MRDVFIVVDYQNDFVDGSLGSADAQKIYQPLLEHTKDCVAQGQLVIATLDEHTDGYLSTQEGMKLPVEHCMKGTHGARLFNALDGLGLETCSKGTFGSFELVRRLEKEDIASITLAGVATNICVIANAIILKTAFPEVPVRVKKDLCASFDPVLHEQALNIMQGLQIDII